MTNEEDEDRLKKIRRLLDSEAETHAEPAFDPNKDEPDEQAATTRAHTRRVHPLRTLHWIKITCLCRAVSIRWIWAVHAFHTCGI